MNTQPKTPNYRGAFLAVLIINLALIAGLAGFWWRSHRASLGGMPVQQAAAPETGSAGACRYNKPPLPRLVAQGPAAKMPVEVRLSHRCLWRQSS